MCIRDRVSACTAAHTSSTLSSAKANTAAIVEGFCSQAFCIALALINTSFSASSKLNTRLATNAENSPNECPATISGFASCSVLNAATECKNTACLLYTSDAADE